MSAAWSNVIATAVGTIPSFELNRRWVWSQGGNRPQLRQILPFCLLSFAGLVLSTLSVHIVGDATAHSGRTFHTASVEIANLASYGALWVLQFIVCDKVLFRVRADAPPPPPTTSGETMTTSRSCRSIG
jgi:putative flippase GtrA